MSRPQCRLELSGLGRRQRNPRVNSQPCSTQVEYGFATHVHFSGSERLLPAPRGSGMRQLTRLMRYALPYWWQILSSVLLMAAVGALDAFKFLLIRPIFDRVLNPSTGSKDIQLFVIPVTHHAVYLQQLVPARFTNAWNM